MELVEGVATVDDVDTFLGRLDEVATDHDVTIQAFDARYVLGRAHLARAVALADRAIAREEAIARDRAVEILLYAAGRRQIQRALEMGVSEGECPVVVLVDEEPDDGSDGGAADEPTASTDVERAAAVDVADLLEPAETLGSYDPERVRSFFGITPAERAATDADLAALVGERVALLAVER